MQAVQEIAMALEGSKVVVVGGSSGIGLGAAKAIVERGAKVVLVGRSVDKLRGAAQALSAPKHVSTISADVTVEGDVERMFSQVGSFDHLIVTRGTPPPAVPIESTDLPTVRSFIDVMLVSAFSLAKHARGKLRPGGSMTFTSGISKDRPGIPGGAVVAAVAGSFGYMGRALALELAPTRVNVVSPGWVDTPMWDDIVGNAKHEIWAQMASRLPARRIGTVADIAKAYVFLLESEFTTGTVLEIDGGHALI
jgi:NAD(P)-dependent dehydrogenase (short-subunit alcohol dehydrogenase family)